MIYGLSTCFNIPESNAAIKENGRQSSMSMPTGGLATAKSLLGKCGISITGQLCSFLSGTQKQVGS